MLTRRGFWLLLLLLLLLFVTVGIGDYRLITFSLTLLTWFGFEWVNFFVRYTWTRSHWKLTRLIDGRPISRAVIWMGRTVPIQVELTCSRWYGGAYVEFEDRLPSFGTLAGKRRSEELMHAPAFRRIEYRLTCSQPGRLRFEGVRGRVRDQQELFEAHWFIRIPVECNVLPPLVPEGGTVGTRKEWNQLSQHGVHRHLRAGSGTELLDLRDYQPGDPPKTIAWKISARRGRLITKEYESEVPVRCTLLVDVSDSMRVGPAGRTLLDFSSYLVAGLSQRLLANRDPVGLVLFDDKQAQTVAPANGERQLTQIYARLAETISRPLGSGRCPAEAIIPVASTFCEQVYPDLWGRSAASRMPWGERFPLLPLAWQWFLALVVFWQGMFLLVYWYGRSWNFGGERLRYALLLSCISGTLFAFFKMLDRYWHPVPVSQGWRFRRRRKNLATILAAQERLEPGAVSRLRFDDEYFSHHAQQFLARHRVPFPRPLFSEKGEYLYACPGKIEVVARQLLRQVAHGKDNELFVLVLDLLELPADWGPLLKAIRVARSRHHQIVVVTPWPMGIPVPAAGEWNDESMAELDPLYRRFQDPAIAIKRLDLIRFRNAHDRLREELRRIGLPLLNLMGRENVDFVLRQLDQLRMAPRQGVARRR